MKHSMLKTLGWLVMTIMILVLMVACSPTGSTVSLDMVDETVRAGDEFSVLVQAHNVSDLTAMEIHLSFDPAHLEVVELKPGIFLVADFFVQNAFDNAVGQIDYAAAQINRAPASGSGPLLEIVVRAKTAGTSQITVRSTDAVPAGILLSDSQGTAIPLSTNSKWDVSVK